MTHTKTPANDNDPDSLDRRMTEKEAALYLGHSVRTLQKWRGIGGGPEYVRVSARSIRYTRRLIQEWMERRIVANTSRGGTP